MLISTRILYLSHTFCLELVGVPNSATPHRPNTNADLPFIDGSDDEPAGLRHALATIFRFQGERSHVSGSSLCASSGWTAVFSHSETTCFEPANVQD